MTLRIPQIYTDGCVLQSGMPVRLRGWADPHAHVEISIDSNIIASTIADEHGQWQTNANPLTPGGPYTLTFCEEHRETIKHSCYVGEVFLCAGQSNMELTMQWLRYQYPSQMTRQADPYLRQYKVDCQVNFDAPALDHDSARWVGCDSENIGEFSALAYFFGMRIRTLLNVPVGLLNVSLGGSPIESWMDPQSLEQYPQLLDIYHDYARAGVAQQRSEKSLAAVEDWLQELQHRADKSEPAPVRNVQLPADSTQLGIDGFCGMIQLRKTIILHDDCNSEALLRLGTLADIDCTSVNGHIVGSHNNKYELRDYSIERGILHKGANEIVITLISNDGKGRVTPGKQLELYIGDACINLAGTWQLMPIAQMEQPSPSEDFIRWKPVCLFNGMLSPCVGYTVRAALWYQGESNTGNTASSYGHMLSAMIDLYRELWGQPRLPFLVVQLPNIEVDTIEDGGWPLVRQGQWDVSRMCEDVQTVVTLDAGDPCDLHPGNKDLVASRLFDAARHLLYGEEDTQLVVLETVREENTVRIRCGTRGGAVVSGECAPSRPVMLRTLDGSAPQEVAFVWNDAPSVAPAAAHIEGDCLIVTLPDRTPDCVRYAWSNNPHRGLIVDNEGSVLPPFCLDLRTMEVR